MPGHGEPERPGEGEFDIQDSDEEQADLDSHEGSDNFRKRQRTSRFPQSERKSRKGPGHVCPSEIGRGHPLWSTRWPAGEQHSLLIRWYNQYKQQNKTLPPATDIANHPQMGLQQWGAFQNLNLALLWACHNVTDKRIALEDMQGPDCVINNREAAPKRPSTCSHDVYVVVRIACPMNGCQEVVRVGRKGSTLGLVSHLTHIHVKPFQRCVWATDLQKATAVSADNLAQRLGDYEHSHRVNWVGWWESGVWNAPRPP